MKVTAPGVKDGGRAVVSDSVQRGHRWVGGCQLAVGERDREQVRSLEGRVPLLGGMRAET